MAGTQEILQEYLIKIGYQTDAISLKKFEDGLGKTGKTIFGIGTKVAGAVLAVEAASAAFAYSMRKVYFSAELSNVSVKNLKAMQYAGEQVGISGDAMAASLHKASIALRNPGLRAYADSLSGISTAGMETDEVLNKLVNSTKGMSEVIGASVMSQFMDSETYHMWREHGDELMKKKREHLAMQKQMGLDYEKNEAIIKEYTGTLDKLEARLSGLAAVMMSQGLPAFKEFAHWTDVSLESFTSFLKAGEESSKYDWMGRFALRLSALTGIKFTKNDLESHLLPIPKNVVTGKINYSMPGKIGGASPGSNKEQIEALLTQQGWGANQRAGIMGNLYKESSFNPGAHNKEGMYGLAQWNKSRQADFKARYGKDIHESTLEEQVDFLTHEMSKGKESSAGKRLVGAGSANEAGQIVSRYYERPGNADQEAALRGKLANQFGGIDQTRLGNTAQTTPVVNNTNNVTITANGGDTQKAIDRGFDRTEDLTSEAMRMALGR